jgi:hypothetical protein
MKRMLYIFVLSSLLAVGLTSFVSSQDEGFDAPICNCITPDGKDGVKDCSVCICEASSNCVIYVE